MKMQGAVAPLSHRLDTLSRVEHPKQDWGGESAAHVRMTEASRHDCVGGTRMHGGELKWYDLLSCLTDGAHAEMLRRHCANQGAIAPLRIEYDTST